MQGEIKLYLVIAHRQTGEAVKKALFSIFNICWLHLSVKVMALCHSDIDDFYVNVPHGFIQT